MMYSNVVIMLSGWETSARPCWQTEFLVCFCWECRTDKNFSAGREISSKRLSFGLLYGHVYFDKFRKNGSLGAPVVAVVSV